MITEDEVLSLLMLQRKIKNHALSIVKDTPGFGPEVRVHEINQDQVIFVKRWFFGENYQDELFGSIPTSRLYE